MSGKTAATTSLGYMRKRFIDQVKESLNVPKSCGNLALALCSSKLSQSQIDQAKILSKRISHKLSENSDSSLVQMTPQEVEDDVFVSLCARNYNQVWTIAQKVQQDPMNLRFRSPSLYLLLLELISARGDRSQVTLALNLYLELLSQSLLLEDTVKVATLQLFKCFESCQDFTQLIPLRILYENTIVTVLPYFEYEALFLGAHLHVFLNTGQYNQALALMHQSFESFPDHEDQLILLQKLPLLKLFDTMCNFKDCNSLEYWLSLVLDKNTSSIPYAWWSQFLSLATSQNHYGLVKLIYTHVIMAGHDKDLAIEDVITNNVISNIEAQSTMLATLSDHTLQAILHTLASHGDVELTLSLIEWHYIHKEMRGERALTKDLCIDIIRSYCFNNDFSATPIEGEHDSSVEKVLDVLESFLSRLKEDFHYTDISDAFSHKINTLNVFDQNVFEAARHETATVEFINQLEEPEQEARKLKNENIYESPQGNVFMNQKIMQQVIISHLTYMKDRHMSEKCIRLYTECILNHINKYQNASGVINAMLAMKKFNCTCYCWFTPSVFDILFKSISNSAAARLTGYTLLSFMKQTARPVSKSNVENLIFSSLRGPQFNPLLEFYIHEYLSTFNQKPSVHVTQRIQNFSSLNDNGKRLLEFLKDHTVEFVRENWEAYGFNSAFPQNNLHLTDDTNEHYHQIDVRDSRQLAFILDMKD